MLIGSQKPVESLGFAESPMIGEDILRLLKLNEQVTGKDSRVGMD
jgi:hypothetical protein